MSFICDFISRIDEDDEDEDDEDEVVVSVSGSWIAFVETTKTSSPRFCRNPPKPMYCLEDNDVEILEEEVE